MTKIKAVMFDLDGTLTDSFRDLADGVNHVLVARGKPKKSVEEVRRYVGHGLKATLEQSLGEDDHGINGAVEMFRRYYWDHCVDNTVLYPGVVGCLDELDGYKKGLVTNKRRPYAEKIIDTLGIREYFDGVFGGDDFPALKPNPAALLFACERIGVEVAETVMVGDGLPDIDCAVAAGAISCAVTYGIGTVKELKSAGAKYLLDSLEELPAVIEKILKNQC